MNYLYVCRDFCPSKYFVQKNHQVCLHIYACINAYANVNLLLMLGPYSSTCVVLRWRIAFLPTKQSTSCPQYKQTGYNDQYGYQTHPTVAVRLNVSERERGGGIENESFAAICSVYAPADERYNNVFNRLKQLQYVYVVALQIKECT